MSSGEMSYEEELKIQKEVEKDYEKIKEKMSYLGINDKGQKDIIDLLRIVNFPHGLDLKTSYSNHLLMNFDKIDRETKSIKLPKEIMKELDKKAIDYEYEEIDDERKSILKSMGIYCGEDMEMKFGPILILYYLKKVGLEKKEIYARMKRLLIFDTGNMIKVINGDFFDNVSEEGSEQLTTDDDTEDSDTSDC